MYLELKNVTTHNLKGFDLKIPLNQLVVITGPSGSGKSSLAFDTLAQAFKGYYAHLESYGIHSLIESQVNAQIVGPLPPILALSQGVRDWFPYKSVSEILNLNALIAYLFAEFGEVKCPNCGALNNFHNLSKVLRWFEKLPTGTKLQLLLPLTGASSKSLEYFLSQGFTRYVIDGEEYDLSEERLLKPFKEAYLLLDRLVKEEKSLFRLIEDIRLAQSINRGKLLFQVLEGESYYFNLGSSCKNCGQLLSKMLLRCEQCRGMGYVQGKICSECDGLKWKVSFLESQIFGRTLREILNHTLKEWKDFLKENLEKENKSIIEAQTLLVERAKYLDIDYLTLKTPVFRLTLGERKLLEILLIFSLNFSGVLYILDEPTIGLSGESRKKLLQLIREIIERGNSFILIEHDPLFIKEADFVIELGPGAGEKGGYLVRTGKGKDYEIKLPFFEPLGEKNFFEISLGDKKYKILLRGINLFLGDHKGRSVQDFEEFAKKVEQEGFFVLRSEDMPEGKNNKFLVDYLGIWELWREVLVNLPEAKAKGLSKRHFSFYTPEGMCQTCKGKGYIQFQSEEFYVSNLCDTCFGKRLNFEVLNLTYRGYSVFEILDFTFDEASNLFRQHPKIQEIMLWLKDLKVSYLKLSQTLREVSGGEQFRLNLVKKFRQKEKMDFLFLYYPFQGLSLRDLEDLFLFFRKLNSLGITIVIYEPHPLARKFIDYIIN